MRLERNKLAWGAVILLFAICWVLPILEGERGKAFYFGYDGAKLAHTEFWNFVSGAREEPTSITGAIFISIGWLANELFVLGLFAAWRWPLTAQRFFAISLGIMLSWQVLFLESFPLLIGYWCWIASAAIALALSAVAESRRTERTPTQVLADPVTLIGFGIPLVNALAGIVSGGFK